MHKEQAKEYVALLERLKVKNHSLYELYERQMEGLLDEIRFHLKRLRGWVFMADAYVKIYKRNRDGSLTANIVRKSKKKGEAVKVIPIKL